MDRRTRLGLISTLLLATATGCLSTADRESRVADFDLLARHLAAAYANLDECARRDHLDLVSLHETTRAEIATAKTSFGAEAALERFLSAFRDPHLRIDRSRRTPPVDPSRDHHAIELGDDPDEGLDVLGYESRDFDFGIDLAGLEGFVSLPSDDAFPAGVLPLLDSRKLGVLRIADFRPTMYRSIAREVYPEFRAAHSGPWDQETIWGFEDRVADALLDRLAKRVDELEARGVSRLLVDVTRNGGGTSWCDPAARVLTPIELAPPRVAFTRHPHWSSHFESERNSLTELLTGTEWSPEALAWLRSEHSRIGTCLDEARRVPDRSRIFLDGAGSVPPLLYSGSAIVETPLSPAIAAELGKPHYHYRPGAFARRGALFVVMDSSTASASEYFVAMLRDNSAATLLGERTMGAGQGYTRGGTPCRLEHFGRTVKLPDSSRLRADGRPELDGIEPDVPCGFEATDSSRERAQKTFDTLIVLLSR